MLFDAGRTVSFAVSSSGRRGSFARTAIGPLTEVKQDDRGRHLELDERTAASAVLPRRVGYRFDGSDLEHLHV